MHPICHTQLSCTLQQAALIIRIGTTNNVHIHLQIGGEQRERLHQQMRALQRLRPTGKHNAATSLRGVIERMHARNRMEIEVSTPGGIVASFCASVP